MELHIWSTVAPLTKIVVIAIYDAKIVMFISEMAVESLLHHGLANPEWILTVIYALLNTESKSPGINPTLSSFTNQNME